MNTCVKSSNVFERILLDLEDNHIQEISIMEISNHYNVQHRRVYDFFNLMTAFGACVQSGSKSHGKLRWIGLKNIKKTIKNKYAEFEIQSLTKNGIRNVFTFGKSPSLGTLAINFVCLFLFLDVDVLSMQRVVKLLHDKKSDVKSIERRMYVALKFMELIKLVEHTNMTSEYKLMINRHEIVLNGIQKRINEDTQIKNLPTDHEENIKFVEKYKLDLYNYRRIAYSNEISPLF